MFPQEGEDQIIHLLRRLLRDEMSSFRQECDLQAGDKIIHLPAPYVVLDPRKLEKVVLFTHYQHCWHSNFWIRYLKDLPEGPTLHRSVKFVINQSSASRVWSRKMMSKPSHFTCMEPAAPCEIPIFRTELRKSRDPLQ